MANGFFVLPVRHQLHIVVKSISADTYRWANKMSATTGNTRFIQFGRKYKAFAKAVPSGKKIIFALQMAKKQLALSVIFR